MVAVWFVAVGSFGPDVDLLTSHSVDGCITWSPAVSLNTNASTDTGNDATPVVASDGAGTFVAIWSSTDDLGGTIGTDADILVARSPSCR